MNYESSPWVDLFYSSDGIHSVSFRVTTGGIYWAPITVSQPDESSVFYWR